MKVERLIHFIETKARSFSEPSFNTLESAKRLHAIGYLNSEEFDLVCKYINTQNGISSCLHSNNSEKL